MRKRVSVQAGIFLLSMVMLGALGCTQNSFKKAEEPRTPAGKQGGDDDGGGNPTTTTSSTTSTTRLTGVTTTTSLTSSSTSRSTSSTSRTTTTSRSTSSTSRTTTTSRSTTSTTRACAGAWSVSQSAIAGETAFSLTQGSLYRGQMSNLVIDASGFPQGTAWNGSPIAYYDIRVGRGGVFISGCDSSSQRLLDLPGVSSTYVAMPAYSNVSTQMVSNNHQQATDYNGYPTIASDSSGVCVVIQAFIQMNGEYCLAHKAEQSYPWTLDGSSGWLWTPEP